MADQQSSDLLRVLGQLGDAAWAETLLPLLQANKSAGAVALACKQLRQLCHGNQRELKLTRLKCEHMWLLELDAFSRRFPSCSSVVFTGGTDDGVWLHFACVVPLLARLPNLQSLQLNINSSTASRPAHMAPVLQLLRLQLAQMRSLHLALGGSWASDSQQAWAVLGATTQLTKLAIEFKNPQTGDPGLSLQHLSALRPLGSSLQHLEVTAKRVNPTSPLPAPRTTASAALAEACKRVKNAWLCVPRGSRVKVLGLSSGLCRLSNLRMLTLALYVGAGQRQLWPSDARLLLAGWSSLRELLVHTETPEQQAVWEAAAAAAREAGLPLPADCVFYVVD